MDVGHTDSDEAKAVDLHETSRPMPIESDMVSLWTERI